MSTKNEFLAYVRDNIESFTDDQIKAARAALTNGTNKPAITINDFKAPINIDFQPMQDAAQRLSNALRNVALSTPPTNTSINAVFTQGTSA